MIGALISVFCDTKEEKRQMNRNFWLRRELITFTRPLCSRAEAARRPLYNEIWCCSLKLSFYTGGGSDIICVMDASMLPFLANFYGFFMIRSPLGLLRLPSVCHLRASSVSSSSSDNIIRLVYYLKISDLLFTIVSVSSRLFSAPS
jgi:hypothetical protein